MNKIVLLTGILLGLISCQNGDKISLGLNLEEGEKYNFNSAVEMVLIQEMMGQEMDIKMDMNSNLNFESLGVVDNQNLLLASYDFISYGTESPQMQMFFSSEETDSDDPMDMLFKEITKHNFKFQINQQGRVSKVEGVDELWSSVINDNQVISDVEKSQVESQLKEIYGGESFAQTIETSFAIYPEKKVKVGDSWTIETNLQNNYPAFIETTYTLKKIDADYAYLEAIGEIFTKEGDNLMETGGMTFEFDLEGENTSTYKINRDTGWIAEATINQNTKGKMMFSEAPEGMEDQAIKMNLSFVIEIDN